MDANNALVWLTGSLYGHTIENFYSVIPWFVITLPLVLCLSYQLDILNLENILLRRLVQEYKDSK